MVLRVFCCLLLLMLVVCRCCSCCSCLSLIFLRLCLRCIFVAFMVSLHFLFRWRMPGTPLPLKGRKQWLWTVHIALVAHSHHSSTVRIMHKEVTTTMWSINLPTQMCSKKTNEQNTLVQRCNDTVAFVCPSLGLVISSRCWLVVFLVLVLRRFR